MQRMLLVLSALVVAAPAVDAGPIFGRKQPIQNPAKVVELLNFLRNSQDGGRRAEAASDLADVDGQMFPEVAPALIEALLKDSHSGVRRQAAESLGQLEPRTAEAAQALDMCLKNETNILVRLAARTARLGYRVQEMKPPAPPQQTQQGQGNVIPVPPPDANGRLKPVPVPESKPLPLPRDTRGPSIAPPALPLPVVQPATTPPSVPIPPMPITKPMPQPTDGPILLPPR
jgi:hypothetical protein